MIYNKNNVFLESSSPHSLGLQNNMTIPSPGWDDNPLLQNEKAYWGGDQANRGLGCASCDSSVGLLAVVALGVVALTLFKGGLRIV